MSIRIRVIDGITIALCAARSMPKEGDFYIGDEYHYPLMQRFDRDIIAMPLPNNMTSYDVEAVAVLERDTHFLNQLTPERWNALREKHVRDHLLDWFGSSLDFDLNEQATALVEQEESNNPNRTWWDQTYGEESERLIAQAIDNYKQAGWTVENLEGIIQSDCHFALRDPAGEAQWFGKTEAEAWLYVPSEKGLLS